MRTAALKLATRNAQRDFLSNFNPHTSGRPRYYFTSSGQVIRIEIDHFLLGYLLDLLLPEIKVKTLAIQGAKSKVTHPATGKIIANTKKMNIHVSPPAANQRGPKRSVSQPKTGWVIEAVHTYNVEIRAILAFVNPSGPLR